jgi:hypothetical protein
MTTLSQDTVMGVAVVLACLMFLLRERWFLAQTGKGQRLVRRFGDARAVWILRGILLSIATLGILLATGWIRPIQW